MGQKVNPIGLRLGINRTWDSRWFANKGEYSKLVHEDMAIRAALMKQLKQAAVSKIVIERPHRKCRVTIHSRSEEHTSELQSRQYLVCRLLLEKKKKNNTRFKVHQNV